MQGFLNIFLTNMLLCFVFTSTLPAQHKPFSGNSSVTWNDCISRYKSFDERYEDAYLAEMGTTDVGKPLHVFIINKERIFHPQLFNRNKTIILVNNGIHPGEPDGIDASLILCEELLADPQNSKLLDSVIVCVIPVYNVDGALNRGTSSRANQDGPEEYGFRGNARNLDLNRDFIKCDSRNAASFTWIFTAIRPHVFIDTHVSNGADYPYVMTLVSTQADKLGGPAGKFLRDKMEPELFARMKNCGHEMCPYVNTMGRTPESGIADFLETPRFATGYAALFNTLGFITETHMLKPFEKRVEATYQFLFNVIKYADENSSIIVDTRNRADDFTRNQSDFILSYELDTNQVNQLNFHGYESKNEPSPIGGSTRLLYDHQTPFIKEIPFYRRYKAAKIATVPSSYFIPQAWHEVIERLQWNGVEMDRFKTDTIIEVEALYIDDIETQKNPYEGHYLHYNVATRKTQQLIMFFAGDYIVPSDQPERRFIAETLEPAATDSYFAWNFFDSVLQQKEWFSDYVFEEKAMELLETDKKLRAEFNQAMLSDQSLAEDHWNQLYWIYRHSKYYEPSAFRYPVYRSIR